MGSKAQSNQTILQGLIFAIAGYASYSVHDAVVKSLNDYNVFQILFFAMLFTYVPFSMVRIAHGTTLSVKPNHPKFAITRAILHVCSLGLVFSALTLLPLVEVYVILFCTPLIISVLAIFFLSEKIALVRWLLIMLGFLGVIIVLRPTFVSIEFGHLLALGCAFTSACSAIIARKVGATENMATMILFPLLATILVSGVALYFVYKPMPLEDLGMMFLVGGLGLIGQYCILSGFRAAPAAYIAPMQYSQIIWAILFGYLFFNETVDQWTVIGGLLTIASGIGMILRERQVSKVKANINTRNARVVGAPHIESQESEQPENRD